MLRNNNPGSGTRTTTTHTGPSSPVSLSQLAIDIFISTMRILTQLTISLATVFYMCEKCESANILFYHGVSTYSHRITVWNFIHTLIDRGHNVSIFQPTLHTHKLTHPQVHDFFPDQLKETIYGASSADAPQGGNHSFLRVRLEQGHFHMQWYAVTTAMASRSLFICEVLLRTKVGLEWVHESDFDLVVLDAAYNECALGLAHLWKAKVVLFATSTLFTWYHEPFGIVQESSWLPDAHISYPVAMTFWQRIVTTLLPIALHFNKVSWYYPRLDQLLKERLNMSLPPVQDLEQRINLMLINSHYSEEFARALPPFVVSVGGIHLSPRNANARSPLPQDLEEFLHDCGDDKGFILISFGSAVRISDAPESLRHVLLTALRNSKTCFVWKWEGERPIDMPSNVFTATWLPQQALLANENIRAFLTHGGLMSVQEAIQHAVPMLALPVFADQEYNSERIHRLQRGIRLDITTLTIDELQDAIQEILINPQYKNNMLAARKLFEDRPRTPLEEAMWWTEYVLRHEDTEHLKPLAMHQTWFQRRLLDVWFFLFVILIFILVIWIKILQLVWKRLRFVIVWCTNTKCVRKKKCA